jgi:hypothetical protein
MTPTFLAEHPWPVEFLRAVSCPAVLFVQIGNGPLPIHDDMLGGIAISELDKSMFVLAWSGPMKTAVILDNLLLP